jgi:LysM repeat protein
MFLIGSKRIADHFLNLYNSAEIQNIRLMKIFNLKKILPVLFCFLVLNNPAESQVVVERSKNKVIIAGVAYYIHQVKKGETAYSISKAYGISVENLTKENPPAVYGINEGQSLRIPVGLVTDSKISDKPDSSAVKKKHDDAHFLYHNLNPGETIYSLSKVFGVSENDIMESNPGLELTKLSIGTELAIPKREFMNTQQKFDDRENNYEYHKVVMGETLSSIAKQYGLSVRQLRKENKDIRFPQVGDFIKIPGAQKPEKEELVEVKTDTVVPVAEIQPVKVDRSAGFTVVKDLKGTLDVAVLLPFYLSKNSTRLQTDSTILIRGKYKTTKVSDDWIYSDSKYFIEMYNGILLAADTLRTLGLTINIHTYDIKDDTVEISRLINSGKLATMDLIIGPVYSNNLSIVSKYASTRGIPVVSPVPLENNTALIMNPTLFMACSSLEIAQKAIAKKISEYNDHNIVFVHADTLGIDPDVKRFKSLIFSELSKKMPYEDIRFKEFKFYSKSMFNNDSINRLSQALSDQSKNIIIVASEYDPIISELIDNVSSLARRYDIKLFAYPVIRELDRLEQKELFDMDILVYSPYWIDYSKKNVKLFNAKYQSKFYTQPLEKSYAWQGYDVAYYFLSGIAMNGRRFIEHPEIHYPEMLESQFDFQRKAPGDGFENQKLFMVRYAKDYEVILEDENPQTP